jgi:hypothetical protein
VGKPIPNHFTISVMNSELYNRSDLHQYYAEKHRDLPGPAPREVPASMKHRFATYEEYEEAMHDFLNGN